MRQRSLVVSLVAAVWLLSAVPPAAAGGWWSYVHVKGRLLGAGETVTASSEAFFTTVEQAEAAVSTPYYAYLVRGYDKALLRAAMGEADPQRWWALTPGAEVIRVGRLRFGAWDANVGEARARIEIPDDVTGRWHLMFCDDGCRTPMGHAIPTKVRVTADPATAQSARRIAALERRNRSVVAGLRADVSNARAEAAEAKAVARDARRVLNDMTVHLQLLEARTKRQPAPTVPWLWLTVALLLGLVVGAVATHRGRPAPQAPAPPEERLGDSTRWERPARPVAGGRRR